MHAVNERQSAMKNTLPEKRQARGWSQDELGRRIGVSRQTINAIERGKTEPSLKTALRLSKIFGVEIEDIFIEETQA